jgi:hypothetical protein
LCPGGQCRHFRDDQGIRHQGHHRVRLRHLGEDQNRDDQNRHRRDRLVHLGEDQNRDDLVHLGEDRLHLGQDEDRQVHLDADHLHLGRDAHHDLLEQRTGYCQDGSDEARRTGYCQDVGRPDEDQASAGAACRRSGMQARQPELRWQQLLGLPAWAQLVSSQAAWVPRPLQQLALRRHPALVLLRAWLQLS